MTNTQLKAIESHIAHYLAVTGVREEIRHYLENNAILDENGEEIETDVTDFEWEVSLNLDYQNA